MTVAPGTLAALIIATLIVALLPIGLYRFLRKPMALNKRDAIIGIAVFTLFATLLERGFYGLLLGHPSTMLWLAKPTTFLVFGAVTAAVFEEVGRYLGMRFLDRRYGRSGGDGRGLGYGIGHGGAQAWFVGVLVLGQWVYLAWLANRGQLSEQLATMPADLALRIQVMLATMSVQSIAVTVLERVAAFVFQVLLSVLMWRGVRTGKRWILPLLIVVHPLGDLPSILYNIGAMPFEWMEGLYVLMTALFVVWLARNCRPAAAAA
ncbi:YhfC family intramembrane metalloprotease [Burkholderia alba]|uniref:YhfC family intramembrane metalloprotease n=1 Tax=Burkholderia alba TaxID=2683677 RepID=UPI002B05570B|nr:YhfC family intramembrane metalloprotease [Burkholderia alba]